MAISYKLFHSLISCGPCSSSSFWKVPRTLETYQVATHNIYVSAMVEAIDTFKMTSTSMSNTYKVFHNLHILWMYGWVFRLVQTWAGHFVTPLKRRYDRTRLTDESQVKNHTKSTNRLPNTITMMVEPLAPPAAWIWWIRVVGGVGGPPHIFSNAAVNAI